MGASRYNVGDRVLVRVDLEANVEYGDWNATDDMAALAGEEVTIESVEHDDFYGENYKIDGSPWGWTDEMFSGLAIVNVICHHTDDETKELNFSPGKIEELYSL